VIVDVHGLGPIAGDVGQLILAVLAQIADMERRRSGSAPRQAVRPLGGAGGHRENAQGERQPRSPEAATALRWPPGAGERGQHPADGAAFRPLGRDRERYCAAEGERPPSPA
jgi:putative DNA-invertase from lambdoid prophage Rac